MIFRFFASNSQLHPAIVGGGKEGKREQHLVWESLGGSTKWGSTIPKPQQMEKAFITMFSTILFP